MLDCLFRMFCYVRLSLQVTLMPSSDGDGPLQHTNYIVNVKVVGARSFIN